MTVAFDTMVLIWGLKRQLPQGTGPEQADLREMQRRAAILLDQLNEDGETIIIPSIAVAELLVPISPQAHNNFLAELQRRFFCPPFDIHACSLAARLWSEHRQIQKEQQLERKVLKSDVMIVATAKVAGATVFYSHDAKCRRLAKMAGIRGEDLPERHRDMHVDAELRQKMQDSAGETR